MYWSFTFQPKYERGEGDNISGLGTKLIMITFWVQNVSWCDVHVLLTCVITNCSQLLEPFSNLLSAQVANELVPDQFFDLVHFIENILFVSKVTKYKTLM